MDHVYKLRIKTTPCDQVTDLYKRYSTEYLCAYESQDTENPHVHMFLKLSTKPATVRAYIRKNWGTGNAHYSLKKLDEEYPIEYIAYCMKCKNYSHNLPDKIIKEAQEYDDKVKTQMKEKKSTRIIDTIDRLLTDEEKNIVDERKMFEVIYSKVESLYIDADKPRLAREFADISVVQGLLLRYNPNYRQTYSTNIMLKVFPYMK